MLKATRREMEWISSSIHHVGYGTSLARNIDEIGSNLASMKAEGEKPSSRDTHYYRILRALRDDETVEYGNVMNCNHLYGLVAFTQEAPRLVREWLGR